MPYKILKVSRSDTNDVTVIAQFPSEPEAYLFAERAKQTDHTDAFDYVVQLPQEGDDPVRPHPEPKDEPPDPESLPFVRVKN